MEMSMVPNIFSQLLADNVICAADIVHARDGFWMICKPLSDILAEKGILDFPDTDGTRLACDRFFDDWFLYAVPGAGAPTYSLLKMREQEHDQADATPADGDTPGVTISFIAFSCEVLLDCLAAPVDENRTRLDGEIHRVVAAKGQSHHKDLKQYFIAPTSEGARLIADLYVKRMASFAKDGKLDTPECYRAMVGKRGERLPRFIASVNQAAKYTVCDNETIYIQNQEALSAYERAVILATHTGNVSEASFSAEVNFHARFLHPLAKIKLPLLGRSAYESAIRADMSVGDKEPAVLTWLWQRKS